MGLSLSATAQQSWTGTWATAAEFTGEGDMPKASLAGKSLREVVHVSIGGERLRLQLSNEFSAEPVEIRSVYIADARDSSAIDAKSAGYLSFNGRRSVTIGAGEAVWSDDIRFSLKPLQRLSITVCYGRLVPVNATSHRGSRTTSYIADGESRPGKPFRTVERVDHWYNIAKIDVQSSAAAIAVLGNSITDGRGSTTNAQNRWTDFLAESLNGKGSAGGEKGGACKPTGVLNLGIGGNCVVEGGLSEPALKRFDRDILGQSGVKTLVIFEGTNDIGLSNGNSEQVARRLIEAYQTLTEKARKAGMRVFGATITPFKGNGWYSFFHEAARQTVNEWIRMSGNFDGIIDFDTLVCDPADKEKLQESFSDDWLHLTPQGYEAMGKYAAEILKEQ